MHSIFEDFRRLEEGIRRQYNRPGELAVGAIDDMLERPTRRYVIDRLLEALDWNPANPHQVVEEARANGEGDERFYFDYLGISTRTGMPVLLVEAKAFDEGAPRRQRGPELDATSMAKLIAEAVNAVKSGSTNRTALQQWVNYLRDLRDYVSSLDELGKATLRRVVITAGRWMIVFREPVATFVQEGLPSSEHIVCFASLDDILRRHGEVYKLLHRGRLTDTLPSTLKVAEALRVLPAAHVGACFGAVLVATTAGSGARRQRYPTRSVYAAIMVQTGGRWFAVVDYESPVEEPKNAPTFADFLVLLAEKRQRLVERLSRGWGVDLRLDSLRMFPGMPMSAMSASWLTDELDPAAGSDAERLQAGHVTRRVLVAPSGEAEAAAEFIVVTGDQLFYKSQVPNGPDCSFHLWRSARDAGCAAPTSHLGYQPQSYTEDGQPQHCAHEDLRGIRAERCHIRSIESHMCCRACAFASDCWTTDADRLPCP